MKYLLLVLLLSGCASAGTLLQGMGQGLQNSNRGTAFCTTQNYGYYTRVRCN